MFPDRRTLLGAAAVVAGSVPAVGSLAAPATGRVTAVRKMPRFDGPLGDRLRMSDVLKTAGLSGLVVSDPISLFYLTGLDTTHFLRSLDYPHSVFALAPAGADLPVGVAMNAFNYYYGFSSVQADHGLAIFQFNAGRPAGPADPTNTAGLVATGQKPSNPGDLVILRDRHQVPLDTIERVSAGRTRSEAEARGVAESVQAAIAKAGGELGMAIGRVACDAEPGSSEWAMIAKALPNAVLQPAAPALARIRLVKSSREIALMRYAAQANAEAAHAACLVAREGGDIRDLRAAFFTEAARRGGLGAWINIDRLSVDPPSPGFRDGQAMMLDAVSTYHGYHGDHGRTVFIGAPLKSMRRHTDAIAHAWDVVKQRLKPGVKFSEIQTIGQESLDKGGFDTAVRITPHSVGVLHTDAHSIGDTVLEAGMTITVDLPVFETGIGGSAHLEDLVLITADGCEVLHDLRDPTITV